MGDSGSNWTIAILACLLLVAAVAFGALAFPKTVEKTVKVPFAVPSEPKVVKENVTVEKIVYVDSDTAALNSSLSEYKAYLADADNMTCDGVYYDLKDVVFGDVKNLAVSKDTSDRHDTLTTVSFDIKNKYSDGSDGHPCYKTDSVEVVLHSKANIDAEVSVN